MQDRGREVVLRPDFTVMNQINGKIYLMEHLGMMDQPDYYVNTMEKISLYEKNGYYLGKQLLIFHETKDCPISSKVLEWYIQEYLM